MYSTTPVYASWLEPYFTWLGTSVSLTEEIIPFVAIERVGDVVKSQESVPDFKRRIAERKDATSPRTAMFTTFKCRPAFWLRTWHGLVNDHPVRTATECRGGAMSCGFKGIPLGDRISPRDAELLLSRATSKFITKLREKVATFGGPMFLAELKETIMMFVNPMKGIVRKSEKFYQRIIRYLQRRPSRRRRPGFKKNLEEFIQDGWLTWKLGISPLIGDIESIISTLADYKKRVTLPVKAASFMETENECGNVVESLGHRWYSVKTKARASVAGALHAEAVLPPDSFGRLQQAAAMDWNGVFRDFIPTVYNLIPLSFVADYFSNLGAVLEADLGYVPRVAWVSSCVREDVIRFQTIQCFEPETAGGWYENPDMNEIRSDGESTLNVTYLTRTVGLPEVHFEFQMPSLVQVITVGALGKLASRLRRLI